MTINMYEQILSGIDPRVSVAAKLRALYPVIERNLAAGLSYQMILDDLKEVGLEIRHGVFRQMLFRVRKQNKAATPPTNQPKKTESPLLPASTPTPSVKPEQTPLPSVSTPPKRIESPADLRAIRDMEIDLNALRERGLARRRQEKNDEK